MKIYNSKKSRFWRYFAIFQKLVFWISFLQQLLWVKFIFPILGTPINYIKNFYKSIANTRRARHCRWHTRVNKLLQHSPSQGRERHKPIDQWFETQALLGLAFSYIPHQQWKHDRLHHHQVQEKQPVLIKSGLPINYYFGTILLTECFPCWILGKRCSEKKNSLVVESPH